MWGAGLVRRNARDEPAFECGISAEMTCAPPDEHSVVWRHIPNGYIVRPHEQACRITATVA